MGPFAQRGVAQILLNHSGTFWFGRHIPHQTVKNGDGLQCFISLGAYYPSKIAFLALQCRINILCSGAVSHGAGFPDFLKYKSGKIPTEIKIKGIHYALLVWMESAAIGKKVNIALGSFFLIHKVNGVFSILSQIHNHRCFHRFAVAGFKHVLAIFSNIFRLQIARIMDIDSIIHD